MKLLSEQLEEATEPLAEVEVGTTSSGNARTSDGRIVIITTSKGYEVYEITAGLEMYQETIPRMKRPADAVIRRALMIHIDKTEGHGRASR